MPVVIAPRVDEILEARALYALAERPITFEEFVEWFGPKDDVELIDGVLQRRVAVRQEHEVLFVFLSRLITQHARAYGLGQVLRTRTMVRVNQFRGRLPDLLFVKQQNADRIEPSALRFAPDLVIEVISLGDRVSDIVALEADYRNIGVPEILLIDQRHQVARVLRRASETKSADAEYREEIVGIAGAIRLDSLGGVSLPVGWLFTEPRPAVRSARAAWKLPHTRVSSCAILV